MYGDIEIEASAMMAFIELARARTGVHVTPLHLVGRAVAYALRANPDLNVTPHGARLALHQRVDVSFIVTFNGGVDQATVTIEDAAGKSAIAIAKELTENADRLRGGSRPDVARIGRVIDRTPVWLIRPLLRLATWATVDLGVDLGRVGLRRGLFGTALVTSLGGMGIDHAYPLISPFHRVVFTFSVGRMQDRPVAVDGEVQVRPMVTISAAMDHRYVDGSHAARIASAVRRYCSDPGAFEPPFTGEGAGAPPG
jgi:pyruvate/2-oxoglutarate dehydrogenase complex dihydrolipoamide acyltransferase (E2) component